MQTINFCFGSIAISFCFNFGQILGLFTLFGPFGAIFGVGVRFKNFFGTCLHRLTTFILEVQLYLASKIFLVYFAWRLGPIRILKFTKNIVVLPRVATNLVLSRKCEFNLVDPFTGPHMYQVRLPKNQSLWVMWLNIFGRNSPEIPFQVQSRHLYCDVRLRRT